MSIDINHPRCRICPMLSPECVDKPCAMYGKKLTDEERADPQLMFHTLNEAEDRILKRLLEGVNGHRNL